MSSIEERLKINGKLPKSRLVNGSGCRVTSLETMLKVAKWKDGFGMVTMKSASRKARKGNHPPIYCADPDYGVRARRNAVGLANPGTPFLAEELEQLKASDLNGVILNVSVFGGNYDEFMEATEDIAPYADCVEDNFSCPHAEGAGSSVGWTLEEKVKIVKDQVEMGLDVFVKETPNQSDEELAKAARAYVEAGAKGIVVINTVTPAETFLPGTSTPVLFNGKGGGSGHHVKERGLQCVEVVRKAVGPKPIIIGMGGVFTGRDAREYLEAGADFVGIGTSMEFMSSELLRQYLMRMNLDIEQGGDSAEMLLPACSRLQYDGWQIDSVSELSDSLRVFTFDGNIDSEAAQYVFLAVPGNDFHPTMEAPFSVPVKSPFTLAVRKYHDKGRKHHFTSRLWELGAGDEVFVRGPYGVPFTKHRYDHVMLVGGGTGTAALASIAQSYPDHTAFIGVRNSDEVLFRECFNDDHIAMGYIDSEGQIVGKLAHERFAEFPFRQKDKEGYLVTCGPNPMMKSVIDVAVMKGLDPGRIFAVMEPYMKCGVGICGSCSDHKGNIACTDGHIVDANHFLEAWDLGKVKRGPDGAWEYD